MCPFTLSGRIPVIALVGLYLTNKLIGRRLFFRRRRSAFPRAAPTRAALSGITPYF